MYWQAYTFSNDHSLQRGLYVKLLPCENLSFLASHVHCLGTNQIPSTVNYLHGKRRLYLNNILPTYQIYKFLTLDVLTCSETF